MRALILLLFLASPALQVQAAEVCTARSGQTALPLVELYTSEGCSSCPPADRWLSKRFARGEANFLAFHVDYWDDIGWPDRFASPIYSRRQRERVVAAGRQAVYTPQVMLGSMVDAPWSRDQAWQKALRQASGPARAALALRLSRHGGRWFATAGAALCAPKGAPAQLWMALHVDGEVTAVRAGENSGRTLRHDRVVRQLWGPWTLASEALSQRITLPASTGSWGVTLFVQDTQGGVLQSLSLDAAGCGS